MDCSAHATKADSWRLPRSLCNNSCSHIAKVQETQQKLAKASHSRPVVPVSVKRGMHAILREPGRIKAFGVLPCNRLRFLLGGTLSASLPSQSSRLWASLWSVWKSRLLLAFVRCACYHLGETESVPFSSVHSWRAQRQVGSAWTRTNRVGH